MLYMCGFITMLYGMVVVFGELRNNPINLYLIFYGTMVFFMGLSCAYAALGFSSIYILYAVFGTGLHFAFVGLQVFIMGVSRKDLYITVCGALVFSMGMFLMAFSLGML